MTGDTESTVERTLMEVNGPCPLCREVIEIQVAGDGRPVHCPACSGEILIQLTDLFFEKGSIDRCVLCSETHLYRQKDFSQRMGCLIFGGGSVLGLILAGLYGAMWLWAVLLATAALDWLLYHLVPDVVICYRCKSHYREMADNPAIGPFDLQRADAIEGRMGGGFQPPDAADRS